MSAGRAAHVYGPVPSRRLGRSLGVDLVPYKVCNYDCVYCQLGRTTKKTMERKPYVDLEETMIGLERKLAEGDRPNYITLAGSGEPTLHSGIGGMIERIKAMTDIPVAVLTNGSLLWMDEVREALLKADLVLPSLDAGEEKLFRYVNRPHQDLSFDRMVDGLAEFVHAFSGEVWLEVLLLGGVTGMASEVEKIAALVKRIGPARTQLNTVDRPPAEEFAFPLSPDQMVALRHFFPGPVDIISKAEQGSSTTVSLSRGDRDTDILALLGRRPCTAADVASGLGIHLTEAIKALSDLRSAGKIGTVALNKRNFFCVKPPKGDNP